MLTVLKYNYHYSNNSKLFKYMSTKTVLGIDWYQK